MIDQTTGEIVNGIDIDALTRAFPDAARKSRKGGGGMTFSYVDSTTVIHRLIEATGNNYSFAVDRYWSEANTRLALVTLTIPGLGSRSHIGVQAEVANQGEDALAKGAISDGLKKAATLFGVGLELYGPDLNAADGPTTAPAPTRGTQTRSQDESHQPTRSAAPVASGAAPLGYPKVAGIRNTADVIAFMDKNDLHAEDFKSALEVANAYGKEVHNVNQIVIGTGEIDPKYPQQGKKIWPSDIANALGYWFQMEGKQAAAKSSEPAAEDLDDVPFD